MEDELVKELIKAIKSGNIKQLDRRDRAEVYLVDVVEVVEYTPTLVAIVFEDRKEFFAIENSLRLSGAIKKQMREQKKARSDPFFERVLNKIKG